MKLKLRSASQLREDDRQAKRQLQAARENYNLLLSALKSERAALERATRLIPHLKEEVAKAAATLETRRKRYVVTFGPQGLGAKELKIALLREQVRKLQRELEQDQLKR